MTSGWLEHSILDSRNDMNIMQSMAVVPSEVGIPSQLMTGFSFTEMPAQSSILNSRNSIDADHRAIKVTYPPCNVHTGSLPCTCLTHQRGFKRGAWSAKDSSFLVSKLPQEERVVLLSSIPVSLKEAAGGPCLPPKFDVEEPSASELRLCASHLLSQQHCAGAVWC